VEKIRQCQPGGGCSSRRRTAGTSGQCARGRSSRFNNCDRIAAAKRVEKTVVIGKRTDENQAMRANEIGGIGDALREPGFDLIGGGMKADCEERFSKGRLRRGLAMAR